MSDAMKVVGCFAVSGSQNVLCEGTACVIAGSEAVMKQYIASQPAVGTPYKIRKTRFGEIMQGMTMGGVYAFDEDAYSRFSPLASKSGIVLQVSEGDVSENRPATRFIIVGKQ